MSRKTNVIFGGIGVFVVGAIVVGAVCTRDWPAPNELDPVTNHLVTAEACADNRRSTCIDPELTAALAGGIPPKLRRRAASLLARRGKQLAEDANQEPPTERRAILIRAKTFLDAAATDNPDDRASHRLADEVTARIAEMP